MWKVPGKIKKRSRAEHAICTGIIRKMKKQAGLVWVGIIAIAMLFGGCGGKQPVTSGASEQMEAEASETPASEAENSQMKSSETRNGEIESSEIESSETASATESDMTGVPTEKNINPEMEALTAREVVGQMKLGWNLGNTMDVQKSGAAPTLSPQIWETGWGNPVTNPELIDAVMNKGFNVIRIPITWNDHLLVNEDYRIADSWMERVQEIVDYAYDQGAYVIINAHHESWYDPYYDNEEQAAAILEAVWSQIARRFQNYDEHLLFEGMNEPRKVGTAVEWNGGDQEGWEVVNRLNTIFVQTIRNAGGNNPYRILMIPGYAANCWEGIKHLEVPAGDNKIAVSVHAYEPYAFALDVNGRGNWNQDTANIDMIMKSLDDLFISKGIPVVIGEFGAMYKSAEGNEEDRGQWAQYYVHAAKERNIPCIWWDNGAFTGSGELFGLINRNTCEWQYPLVVEGLLKGVK